MKARTLTRRVSNLERLRSECSDRFARDRESLLQKLRGDVDSGAEIIREGIKAVSLNSLYDSESESVNESDIDRLVSEFIVEFLQEAEFIPEPEEEDQTEWHKDWVKCPVCAQGWLAVPVPGVIACDFCELKASLPSEFSTEQDFAALLDAAIQRHNACLSKVDFHIASNGGLISSCPRCGLLPVQFR